MFDVKWIRDDPDAFDRGLARRGLNSRAAGIIELDETWRAAETAAQEIQARRNRVSKEIGGAKARGEDVAPLLAQVASDKEGQAEAEQGAARLRRRIGDEHAALPNLPA